MRSYLCILVCMAIFSYGRDSAWACSYSSSPTTVARDLAVSVVMPGGTPFPGLTVAIEKQNEEVEVASATTDESGIVRFKSLRPGMFYLRVGHEGDPYSIEIKVTRSRKEKRSLKIRWPSGVLEVRSLKGRIRAPSNTGNRVLDLARPQYSTVPSARLTLYRADFGLIERKATDPNGAFEFLTDTPGLYFVGIEREADSMFYGLGGSIPVIVRDDATSALLDLELGELCGRMVGRLTPPAVM